jgi:hypothetical protein
MKKFLFGLAPLLALVVFALAPSAALAQKHKADGPCRVLAAWTALPAANACAEPPGVSATEAQNLRDEADGTETTPDSSNFETSGLLVNTKSQLKLALKIAGVGFANEIPLGYGFFGVDLSNNPTNNKEKCPGATGTVPWVDLQDGKPSAVFDVSTAWSFEILSESESGSKSCKELKRASTFIVREATLLIETGGAGKSPIIASGTFVGNYSQPNEAKCPGGGIELAVKQPGITTEPEAEAGTIEFNNGTAGTAALICFVSSNNYLFPKTAPTWGTSFTNSTEKAGIGIWDTKEA